MIPRRVYEHVKAHNWFAVGIDLVIVVVGVFLGLQVQEISSARADRQTETQTLLAIGDDIRLEREELAEGIEAVLLSVKAANTALVAAGDPPMMTIVMPSADRQLDSNSLDLSALDLSSLIDTASAKDASVWKPIVVRPFPTSSSVAFDTLVSVGKLAIIENEDLIRRLQLYRQLWLGLEQSQFSTYREFRNQAVYAGETVGLSPFTDIAASALATLMQDNVRLKGAVRTTSEFAILHYSQMRNLEREAASLLQLIETELSR